MIGAVVPPTVRLTAVTLRDRGRGYKGRVGKSLTVGITGRPMSIAETPSGSGPAVPAHSVSRPRLFATGRAGAGGKSWAGANSLVAGSTMNGLSCACQSWRRMRREPRTTPRSEPGMEDKR